MTARRKEERLQDVPIAVTAFNSDQLETLGIQNLASLSEFTPGFQFSDYTNGRSDRGAYRSMIFRGITSSTNTAVTSDALTFLDGAPVVFNDLMITDSIERVEVLKGPQNVYFGRSTLTGAVNYVTRNPGNDFKASTTLEIGNYSEYKADAHIEGPIVTNKLAFAFDAEIYNKDGDYTNYAQPNDSFGARQNKSLAMTLYFTPTEDLSFKLYETYFNYNDGIGAAIVIPSAFILNCNPGGSGLVGLGPKAYPCGTIPKLQPAWVAQSNVFTSIESNQLNHPPGGYDPEYRNCDHLGLCADTEGVHLITNYKLPWFGINFSNITAYHIKTDADLQNAVDQNVNGDVNPDFGNPAFPLAPPYAPVFDYNILDKIWDLSTEFRLSSAEKQSFRWTFGTNYVRTKDDTQLWFYTNPTGIIPPNPNYNDTIVSATTIGIFGGLYYDPIDKVTVSAELRNQADRRQNNIPANPPSGTWLEKDFRSWSPRASVEYKWSPDVNFYASYSMGVRPGGFNSGIVGLPQRLQTQIAAIVGTAPVDYDEEKLWTDEIGVKGSFFDHTLSTDISAYVGKLTHQQVSQTAILPVPDPVYGGRFDLTASVGTVDISGVEGDVRWKASRILTLSGTFAYNHTAEHLTGCTQCAAITGNSSLDGQQLANSPEYSVTFGADATDKLTANLDWNAHLDYVYRSTLYMDGAGGLNLTGTGASNKVDASLGIQNSSYVLTAWVTNLTNDLTYTGLQSSFDFLSFSTYGVRAGLPDKRAFGLRLRYNFQ